MGGGHMSELGSSTGCGLRSSCTPRLAKTGKKGPSINVVSSTKCNPRFGRLFQDTSGQYPEYLNICEREIVRTVLLESFKEWSPSLLSFLTMCALTSLVIVLVWLCWTSSSPVSWSYTEYATIKSKKSKLIHGLSVLYGSPLLAQPHNDWQW